MQHDFIPMIEPTPEPRETRCRLLAHAIAAGLKYGAFMFAALVWYRFDLMFGIGAFLIGYLVTGIIRSKLRNSSIPLSQQEYPYTDKAIADWFVVRRMLCDLT